VKLVVYDEADEIFIQAPNRISITALNAYFSKINIKP
jgi:hypothetical protein